MLADADALKNGEAHTSHPINATVYEVQKLRCNLCSKVFTAAVPREMGDDKYDAESLISCTSIFAPIHETLILTAAQGKVIHNDDTTMKVLNLPALNEPDKADSNEQTLL